MTILILFSQHLRKKRLDKLTSNFMLYAINPLAAKIQASPKEVGHCPQCKELMTPKCGEINIWHWAHQPGSVCPAARYGMTEWHLKWQQRFKPEEIEILVTFGGITHIADVIVNNPGSSSEKHKLVMEFQRQAMPVEVMEEREMFWRRQGYDFRWV